MQGLNVSILGLMITFMALGVFILIMVVLQKLFPAEEEKIEQPEPELVVAVETADTSEEGAIVAAIAAAVAYARGTGRAH